MLTGRSGGGILQEPASHELKHFALANGRSATVQPFLPGSGPVGMRPGSVLHTVQGKIRGVPRGRTCRIFRIMGPSPLHYRMVSCVNAAMLLHVGLN
jgi:hypothetical protein